MDFNSNGKFDYEEIKDFFLKFCRDFDNKVFFFFNANIYLFYFYFLELLEI